MAFKNPVTSIIMPPGAVSGQDRMVWGQDVPPELKAFGINVAMLSYVTDIATGLERGYFWIGSSNKFDAGANNRVQAFGNVQYPVAGDPSSATQNDVKTNFQQDMWAQFPETIFKDHTVTFWTDLRAETVNGFTSFQIDSNEMPRGYVEYGNVTAGTVATATGAGEVAVPAASWAHEPNVTFKNGQIYRIEWKYGYGISAAAANSFQVRIRKGSASTTGQVLGSEVQQEVTNLAFVNAPLFVCFVKNTSGADITTKLSATINRTGGANNCSLYGDGNVPFRMTIQALGAESGHTLSPIAVAIT